MAQHPANQPDLFNGFMPLVETRQQVIDGAAEGRQRAVEGATRAADHAEAVAPGWTERAYQALLAFLDTEFGRFQFTSYQIRWWAHEHAKLPFPPDDRAWGIVIRRAAITGRIRRDGYTASPDPIAHARPCQQWKRT